MIPQNFFEFSTKYLHLSLDYFPNPKSIQSTSHFDYRIFQDPIILGPQIRPCISVVQEDIVGGRVNKRCRKRGRHRRRHCNIVM